IAFQLAENPENNSTPSYKSSFRIRSISGAHLLAAASAALGISLRKLHGVWIGWRMFREASPQTDRTCGAIMPNCYPPISEHGPPR
ncbi:MAG: hypothetical protein QHJ82_12610, partial [Verrucomicrobiota bacterium]|nr:hypothetical protein [Verrucomicrobiota bacterium]